MFKLTPQILTKIAPAITGDYAIKVAGIFTKVCPLYGINTADIFHEFIARILVESGQLKKFDENLNYSAQGLANTWPTRYAKDPKAKIKVPNTLAIKLARKPQAIANNAYANRMGNGSEASGDGWRHRGGGPIQITGKDEQTAWTIFYNAKFKTNYTVAQMAELLRTDVEIGIHSACWLFAVSKNLIKLAIDDNVKEIVRRINGGYIGLAETFGFYNLAKQYIKDEV